MNDGPPCVQDLSYAHIGFRNLNQAQLLSDALYYRDGLEAQQWLIYYISRPLIGTVDPIETPVARLSSSGPHAFPDTSKSSRSGSALDELGGPSTPSKKEIKSFGSLLTSFPMIARQMQPGLDKVFSDFNREISKPLPSPKSHRPLGALHRRRSSSASSSGRSMVSVLGGPTYTHSRRASFASGTDFAEDEEDHMRRALESAVTAAIDLFQFVDKQQLSLLGATTDLTGPVVERLIERYITEQVHEAILFPQLCSIHQAQDVELEACIRRMMFVDIAQVGLEIEGGRTGKDQLAARLNRGIEQFRKMKTAESPQRMLQVLLDTQKSIASTTNDQDELGSPEKPPAMEMNADTLVSLLLIVVIRAHVRNLQARLAYMRQFIFIDDVEGGEYGYALSTLEAVLSYLTTDSGGLRTASRRNRKLWQATKNGNLSEMKSILEPDDGSTSDDPDSMIGSSNGDHHGDGHQEDGRESFMSIPHHRLTTSELLSKHVAQVDRVTQTSDLAHVFPFQKDSNESLPASPRKKKRVSIDLRSLSSDVSVHSRTSTLNSLASVIAGDTSIEKLCQTQDLSGNSVLMMAVEARQTEALDYLLSLEGYFPVYVVLEDVGSDEQTLLSAAIQTAHTPLIDLFVHYLFSVNNHDEIYEYLARPDNMGRTAAHYLFQAPHLLPQLGGLISWRQRDKNGQTPLLALCRAYDHPDYLEMVNEALAMATQEQGDGLPLHMDNHVDNKGNTLLHIVSNAYLALRMLQPCDLAPNASNEKRFTPLMIASKFGRFETVRAMFSDQRVDLQAKEYRGMTAVELAKDDEVRNRIDDLVLVSNVPTSEGRVTAVVRSFFVEDATIRVIIKTAARSEDGLIAVTTTRRSLSDFEQLAKWLAIEHPASWLPSIFNFRSPFQLPSKPSRAVLRDIQVRLDKFLEIMLSHPTFSTHELLWEFIVVPEMQLDQMAQRSLLKSDLRQEQIKEDYEPLADYREAETFVTHAREVIRPISTCIKDVLRRANGVTNALNGEPAPQTPRPTTDAMLDVSVAFELATKQWSELEDMPSDHHSALAAYVKALAPTESDPHKTFHSELLAVSSTVQAMMSSLSRPHALIASLQASQKQFERHRAATRRPDRWPLGLLEETRRQAVLDAQDKMLRAQEEVRIAGCELRYTQQTVAAELAGWQDLQGRMTRRAVHRLAKNLLVRERDRLESMKRALRIAAEARRQGRE